MQIKTKDKIVQAVLRKMDNRSLVGQKKYGSTMYDEIQSGEKDLHMFLTDVQEEIMDALLYIYIASLVLLLRRRRRVDDNLVLTHQAQN